MTYFNMQSISMSDVVLFVCFCFLMQEGYVIKNWLLKLSNVLLEVILHQTFHVEYLEDIVKNCCTPTSHKFNISTLFFFLSHCFFLRHTITLNKQVCMDDSHRRVAWSLFHPVERHFSAFAQRHQLSFGECLEGRRPLKGSMWVTLLPTCFTLAIFQFCQPLIQLD